MKKVTVLSFILFSFIFSGLAVAQSDDRLYGEAFDVTDVISINNAIDQLTETDTLVAIFSGRVESVCKVKGCWMNLLDTQEASDDKSIFVKFKDYGFFMPLDCDGSQVILKGKAFKEITSVAELKHYAEDEGKSADEIAKITEPVEEYKIIATGVYQLD